MTAVDPKNDLLDIFSAALNDHAEASPFAVVNKVLKQGAAIQLTLDPNTGRVVIAVDPTVLAHIVFDNEAPITRLGNDTFRNVIQPDGSGSVGLRGGAGAAAGGILAFCNGDFTQVGASIAPYPDKSALAISLNNGGPQEAGRVTNDGDYVARKLAQAGITGGKVADALIALFNKFHADGVYIQGDSSNANPFTIGPGVMRNNRDVEGTANNAVQFVRDANSDQGVIVLRGSQYGPGGGYIVFRNHDLNTDVGGWAFDPSGTSIQALMHSDGTDVYEPQGWFDYDGDVYSRKLRNAGIDNGYVARSIIDLWARKLVPPYLGALQTFLSQGPVPIPGNFIHYSPGNLSVLGAPLTAYTLLGGSQVRINQAGNYVVRGFVGFTMNPYNTSGQMQADVMLYGNGVNKFGSMNKYFFSNYAPSGTGVILEEWAVYAANAGDVVSLDFLVGGNSGPISGGTIDVLSISIYQIG